MLVLPLVLPPTVLGYYLLQSSGRDAWLGRWLEQTAGDRDRLPLDGGGGGVGGGGVPALPAAGAGGDRGGRPGAGGRGAAARAARAVGLLRGHAPAGLARAGGRRGAGVRRALGDFGATMMVAGNIPGRTQTASLAIYDAVERERPRPGGLALALGLARLDRGALAGPAARCPPRGLGR